MRDSLIMLRGLLWGLAIGSVSGSLYGVAYVAAFGPRGRWSLLGGLGFIYGAPIGAALGLLFGALAYFAVRDGNFGESTICEMLRTLLLLCAVAGSVGIVLAVAVARSEGSFPEGLSVLTVPAIVAWMIGSTAIRRFATRYIPTAS